MRKLSFAVAVFFTAVFAQSEWMGLTVTPEERCADYNRSDYPYSQNVELEIIERDGLVSPYTGETFEDRGESDIEHVVATSEAHDSGLCAAPDSIKRAFAGDLLNLTLASPQLNRWEKSGKDAGEWMPVMNRCWFAQTVIAVKQKYDLTIDAIELDSLEVALMDCETANTPKGWAEIKKRNF